MGKLGTVVTTAEGEVKTYAGVVAKFIVAHPRLSAFLSLGAGLLIGHVL